jgi:urease accessory protein
MSTPSLALLRLLRLSSPALPVGAYAYSQGMESAVAIDYVHDANSAAAWIESILKHMLTPVDLAALARLAVARQNNDMASFWRWNDWLLASRETLELHFEDTQMGAALWRILHNLDRLDGLQLPSEGISFAAAFALAGMGWQIAPRELLLGYGWSWLENQVAAATKLVPLGQTAAQGILETLHPYIAEGAERAMVMKDEEMGASLPGLAFLSATHETLYTRLFRS